MSLSAVFPARGRLALLLGLIPWLASLILGAGAGTAPQWPPLAEVVTHLRTVLPDLSAPSANVTNVDAFLKELAPRVLPDAWTDAADVPPPLLKTAVYDAGGPAGYLRPGLIDAGLIPALESALHGMRSTNDLIGVVLDLRRAQGFDHASAIAAAASLTHRPVAGVRVGDRELAAEPVPGRKPLPLMILVSRETRGAAEVLAAILRRGSTPSLLIGSTTAGQGRNYQTVSLSTGSRLRVAGSPVRLPGGDALPEAGLVPDLMVALDARDEQAYLENEFVRSSNGRPASAPGSFRLNEAELVRRRSGIHPTPPPAGGEDPGPGRRPGRGRPDPSQTTDPAPSPAVQDPVLARALDLISGLSTSGRGVGEGDSR